MEKIKGLLQDKEKMRELIVYVLFGVLTTVVNWVIYTLLTTVLGMTGPRDSVLGIRPELSIAKFRGDLTERYRWAEGPTKLEAVLFTIDTATGKCLKAERVDEWD